MLCCTAHRRACIRSFTSNNSFKPNLLRYIRAMAEKACHSFASTAQVGLTQALDVQDNISALAKLEASLSDTSDVYVNSGVDAASYFAQLAASIRQHVCEPFPVSAAVAAPSFPDATVGTVMAGECVAHNAGYWLVYQPERDRFVCFWGKDPENLSAHGVFGSPLYCWSA